MQGLVSPHNDRLLQGLARQRSSPPVGYKGLGRAFEDAAANARSDTPPRVQAVNAACQCSDRRTQERHWLGAHSTLWSDLGIPCRAASKHSVRSLRVCAPRNVSDCENTFLKNIRTTQCYVARRSPVPPSSIHRSLRPWVRRVCIIYSLAHFFSIRVRAKRRRGALSAPLRRVDRS
jgi:hypothetical protein